MLLRLCLSLSLLLSLLLPLHAQFAKPAPTPGHQPTGKTPSISIKQLRPEGTPTAPAPTFGQSLDQFSPLPKPQPAPRTPLHLQVIRDEATELPIYASGLLLPDEGDREPEVLALAWLEAAAPVLELPTLLHNIFEPTQLSHDQRGCAHVRFRQLHLGLEVYGAELIVHFDTEGRPRAFTGRYSLPPALENADPALSEAEAISLVEQQHEGFRRLGPEALRWVGGKQASAKLLIYENQLCYQVTLHPNVRERFEYFLHALTGNVVHVVKSSCQFHAHLGEESCGHHHKPDPGPAPSAAPALLGPETASALDLFNIPRTLNVWEQGGTYFLIDGSRPMFDAGTSSIPNEVVGGIVTLDAQNVPLDDPGFGVIHITSNNNSWPDKKAVSAHYNAGQSYEYFLNVHGRNSINGQGGTIYSIINVSEDGGGFDNAFWNGQAMFYGNGETIFSQPTARSLDVGGHEMSHGVIQSTANLAYENQSGALNESYADIFGAMIDRDDWQLGEDIINSAFFPTGALRDMEDPNNGGNGFGDNGWQPKHMDEFVDLPNTPQGDNGGVHVNSGIPNHAYYLFANSVGKDIAEEIFYDALVNYLVKSSQFIDLRIAIIEVAEQLHGPVVASAAASAFDGVGIFGGQGGNYQQELGENPGEDYVLFLDEFLSGELGLADGQGNFITNYTDPAAAAPARRPSMTDDGSAGVFVGTDNGLYRILIDWPSGNGQIDNISSDFNWRYAAVSRDGQRLAAVTTDFDNQVFVYDFGLGSGQFFPLYNPTTSPTGATTGDVDYADVLEWDFSGQYVMYDAQNTINSGFGGIEYWDIGFIHVWDDATGFWANGQVSKLFSGLPDNVSVGNPTFAKNSPFIIAFDYLESGAFSTTYRIRAANLENGELGDIFTNDKPGVPNYAPDDQRLLFNNTFNNSNILAVTELQANKIQSVPNTATVLLDGAGDATWFANGQRELSVSTETSALEEGLLLFPNPVRDVLHLQLPANHAARHLLLTDTHGRTLRRQALSGQERLIHLSVNDLPDGVYFLQIAGKNGSWEKAVVKK